MTEHCLAWTDLPETMAANGVSKRRLDGAGAGLVLITIPAGTNAARHSHPHEQFIQVISGTGILETEQGIKEFGPGSLFHFPADVWHAAEFVTETVLVEDQPGSLTARQVALNPRRPIWRPSDIALWDALRATSRLPREDLPNRCEIGALAMVNSTRYITMWIVRSVPWMRSIWRKPRLI